MKAKGTVLRRNNFDFFFMKEIGELLLSFVCTLARPSRACHVWSRIDALEKCLKDLKILFELVCADRLSLQIESVSRNSQHNFCQAPVLRPLRCSGISISVGNFSISTRILYFFFTSLDKKYQNRYWSGTFPLWHILTRRSGVQQSNPFF